MECRRGVGRWSAAGPWRRHPRAQDLDQSGDVPDLKVAAQDGAHPLGFFVDRDQLALDHLVAERQWPPHPDALLLNSCDLVADALAGNLALELGKTKQHV